MPRGGLRLAGLFGGPDWLLLLLLLLLLVLLPLLLLRQLASSPSGEEVIYVSFA